MNIKASAFVVVDFGDFITTGTLWFSRAEQIAAE